MSTIKFSLKDCDYVVQADTKMEFDGQQDWQFSHFLKQIQEELAVSQAATLEIDGTDFSVKFEIYRLSFSSSPITPDCCPGRRYSYPVTCNP